MRYPSARAEPAPARTNPTTAVASTSGIPRHLSKRMIYPLLDIHEALLGCLESSERRTCPSLPARGRHDRSRPPWTRGHAGPALPAIRGARREASPRLLSVTRPCPCASARGPAALDRIAPPGPKKNRPLVTVRGTGRYGVVPGCRAPPRGPGRTRRAGSSPAVDHRGRQLGDLLIRIAVGDRGVLLALLRLVLLVVAAELGQAQHMADDVGPIVPRPGHRG